MIEEILNIIKARKFDLQDEKILQAQIAQSLLPLKVQREYCLDRHSIVDFFKDGIAIEVKIKGNRKEIYKQCLRYSMIEGVKFIVLVTNKSIGFPLTLNDKPAYVINLGKSWL